MSETKSTTQPAEVRVNRAATLHRLAEVCLATEQVRLPAPSSLSFFDDGGVSLRFDSAEQVEVWIAHFELSWGEQTYTSDGDDRPIRLVNAHGKAWGEYMQLSGSTAVES